VLYGQAKFSVSYCSFYNCEAQSRGYGSAFGYFWGENDFTLEHCIFQQMRSTNADSWCGVVRWDSTGAFICNNCSFVSCYSGGKGGVMNLNSANQNYNVISCDFFFCAARDIGGAIQGSCKGFIMTSCKFFYNKAGKGGAIYISPFTPDEDGYGSDVNPDGNFNGNISILSSSFVGNNANASGTCSKTSGDIMVAVEFGANDHFYITDCYFERNTISCTGNVYGADVFIGYDYENKFRVTGNSYSRSSKTKIYSVQRIGNENQSDLLPIPNPTTITPNNPIIVDVEGIDKYSCYNTPSEKCHSISFACVAELSDNLSYNISMETGYFYEYHIKAASDNRELSIYGTGIEETTIIALYRTNNDVTTNGTYDGLFYTSSGSLSVKDMTILVTLAQRNIFHHSSTGSFTIENILFRPHPIFLSFPSIFDHSGFYFNSVATFYLKSVVVENIMFSERTVFHFGTIIPPSFTINNCSFNNIERNGGSGSIFNIKTTSDNTFSIENSYFIYCKSSGSGGAIYQIDESKKISFNNCTFLII
jgi:hypothetical protein